MRPGYHRAIRLAALACLAVLGAACRQPPRVEENTAERAPAQRARQEPPTEAPADVSHGEAAVGAELAEPARDPNAGTTPAGRVHKLRLEITHATRRIGPNATYQAWTFSDQVPGPLVRVKQGDTVDFLLVNKAPIPHSLDFHAAEIAPDRYYTNLLPNDSLHYRWVARVPGVFMYHCGTAPVAAHIANGMYGALIVDPKTPRPRAREFVLVQSEFYVKDGAAASAQELDWEKLLSQAPDYVVFNGRADQYASEPIVVRPMEPIRVYMVNAGPNRFSAFHVVGGIFERVFLDGELTTPLKGVQTTLVPVGGSAIFEFRLREPGLYPFVTHAFADATKGAVGFFKADTAVGR